MAPPTQHKSKRGRRRKAKPGGVIQAPNEQTIHARPAEIETQGRGFDHGCDESFLCGHACGAENGLCGVMQNEKQRSRRRAAGFVRQLKKIDRFLRLSMTYDRGSKMAEHPLMSKQLKMEIYFADPHSPWQRGSNENTNGLLRQYLPKGEDLSNVNQMRLNDIAWLLNTLPCKRLGWQTPQEVFDQEIADYLNRVALEC